MITSTEQRIRASRANGARSRGPRTPEGKARSSQNAIQHGFLSSLLLLSGESENGLRQVVDGYLERFAPTDEVEYDLVQEMVAAAWRMRRGWAIETRLIDSNIQDDPASDDLGRLTRAFSKLAGGSELPLLFRYQGRLQHEYQRALRNLLSLRRNHPPAAPASDSENKEPDPVPPPPSPTPEPGNPTAPPDPVVTPAAKSDETTHPVVTAEPDPDPEARETDFATLDYQTNLQVLYFQQIDPLLEPDSESTANPKTGAQPRNEVGIFFTK